MAILPFLFMTTMLPSSFLTVCRFMYSTLPAFFAVSLVCSATFDAVPPMWKVRIVSWVPGSPTVLIGNMPALNNSCKLMCNWGGIIQVIVPGQFTVMVA
jgi:hypothetical protein